MPKIHVVYDGGHGVNAEFNGHLYPNGSNGYAFAGTLKAQCLLDRRSTSFANTVALDHAGDSMPWAGGVKKEIVGRDWNTFEVEGWGKRKPGEDVSFRLGINDTASGGYHFGSTVTSLVGGPPQKIDERFDHKSLAAVVEAEAWAEGPTGYGIKGSVQAIPQNGSAASGQATFGYKGASGSSWTYETAGTAAKDFLVHGTRKSGEDLKLVLGNTGGLFSAWVYDSEVTLKLPEKF